MKPLHAPRTPFKFVLHLPDHMADTGHLSAGELGALMRIMFSYWRSGPPKDDDRILCRLTGMTRSEWSKARPVIEKFFEVANGVWLHWKIDAELEAAFAAIEKSSSAGRAGAKARWGKAKAHSSSNQACDRIATVMRSHCDSTCDGSATVVQPQCESEYQQKVRAHTLPETGKSSQNQGQKPLARMNDLGRFEGDIALAERSMGGARHD